ncbi:MAG: hypothetical protein AAB270_04540 [Chloroflexota bacterium]
MADIKVDQVLDTKGLLCPMPVVKTKLALEEEDLIEGTECAGAASFLEFASGAEVTLFI